MKIEVTGRKINPLLSREEIEFNVLDTRITPKIKEVREKLATTIGKKNEAMVILTLNQKYGGKEVIGKARIYESAEKMKETELPFILEKNFEEEKAKGKKKREEKKAEKEKLRLEKKKKK